MTRPALHHRAAPGAAVNAMHVGVAGAAILASLPRRHAAAFVPSFTSTSRNGARTSLSTSVNGDGSLDRRASSVSPRSVSPSASHRVSVSGQSSVSPRLLQSSDSLRHLVASRADHTPLASPTARRISNALRDLTATRTSRKASGTVVLAAPLKSRLSVSGAGGNSLNPLLQPGVAVAGAAQGSGANNTGGATGSGGLSVGASTPAVSMAASSTPPLSTPAVELPRRSSTLMYYKGPTNSRR